MDVRKCSCGLDIEVSENLIGSGYACPSCGRFYGDSYSLTDAQNEALINLQYHKFHKSSHIPRYIYKLTLIIIAAGIMLERESILRLIGWSSGPSYASQISWLIILMSILIGSRTTCYLVTVTSYQNRTGKLLVTDRAGFGRAGGLDIMLWSPIMGLICLWAIYQVTLGPEDPISFIRGPWLFLLELIIIAPACAWLLSRIVYHR